MDHIEKNRILSWKAGSVTLSAGEQEHIASCETCSAILRRIDMILRPHEPAGLAAGEVLRMRIIESVARARFRRVMVFSGSVAAIFLAVGSLILHFLSASLPGEAPMARMAMSGVTVNGQPLTGKVMVIPGDTVTAGAGGMAVLDFPGGTRVTLHENSSLSVGEARRGESSIGFVLRLDRGWIRSVHNGGGSTSVIRYTAGDISVIPLGTDFIMMKDSSGAMVTLYHGAIRVSDRQSDKDTVLDSPNQTFMAGYGVPVKAADEPVYREPGGEIKSELTKTATASDKKEEGVTDRNELRSLNREVRRETRSELDEGRRERARRASKP